MGALIDFSSLTLQTEEAREASELIQEKVYTNPVLNKIHSIQTGVIMDKFIPILGNYGEVGKIDPGSCGVNTITSQIPTSQKQWAPKLISGRLVHCQANLPDLLKFWKKDQIAKNTWENIDNELIAFIIDKVQDSISKAIIRITEFGNVNAEVVGSGGYLTAGADKTLFNMLNGMWEQIFTDQAGSALSYRHTITENAGGSKAEQAALATDAALKLFRDLYNNSDSRIFDGGTPVFQITRSLFNNWQDYLEDKSIVFTLQRAEQGATVWQYRGIPIIVRDDWDRIISSYHNLGDTFYLPHRAILTDITNIPIGTSDEESLTSLESFYDKKDKAHYIDFAFKIDQKNIQESLLSVAY